MLGNRAPMSKRSASPLQATSRATSRDTVFRTRSACPTLERRRFYGGSGPGELGS